MKWALRVLPFYYALTTGILALFIVISGGHGVPKLEDLGAGRACGIFSVFAGVWVISAVFTCSLLLAQVCHLLDYLEFC